MQTVFNPTQDSEFRSPSPPLANDLLDHIVTFNPGSADATATVTAPAARPECAGQAPDKNPGRYGHDEINRPSLPIAHNHQFTQIRAGVHLEKRPTRQCTQ